MAKIPKMPKLNTEQRKMMQKLLKKQSAQSPQPELQQSIQPTQAPSVHLDNPVPLLGYHDPVPSDMCAPDHVGLLASNVTLPGKCTKRASCVCAA
jgi:hypothetical protein